MNAQYVVIHHSLTKDSGSVSWGAIRDFHLKKGWSNIGYHWGLEMVGDYPEILIGRFSNQNGAHTREMGMNRIGLGICVVGNYDLASPPTQMLNRLRSLVLWLMDDFEIPIQNVIGHRDVGMMAGFNWKKGEYKSCPGKLFSLSSFRQSLSDV